MSTFLGKIAIITDRNLLISILDTRHLDEIENPQLQHLKAHIMGYHFTAQWTKGCKHYYAPDVPSWHPSDVPQCEDMIAEHIYDRIWENVHSSHIRFFTFKLL